MKQIAYNGRILLLNEDGTTWVVDDGPEFKVVRKEVLEDYTRAKPAISRGSLLIRANCRRDRLQHKTDAFKQVTDAPAGS